LLIPASARRRRKLRQRPRLIDQIDQLHLAHGVSIRASRSALTVASLLLVDQLDETPGLGRVSRESP